MDVCETQEHAKKETGRGGGREGITVSLVAVRKREEGGIDGSLLIVSTVNGEGR